MDQQHFGEALTTAALLIEGPHSVTRQGTTESGQLQMAIIEGQERTTEGFMEAVVVIADTDPSNDVAFCTAENGIDNSLAPGISAADLAKLHAPDDKPILLESQRTNTGRIISTALGTSTVLVHRKLAKGEMYIPISVSNQGIWYLGTLAVVTESPKLQS